MKTATWILGAAFVASAIHAQAQQQIQWRRDKVTQLIFPSEVVKFRPGYTSEDALSQHEGRVLYIQPVAQTAETNLNVITADGRYYAFNIIYNQTASTVNYIISPEAAIYQDQEIVLPATPAQTRPDDAPADSATEESEPQTKSPTLPTLAEQLAKVKKQASYIVSNNIARLQKLSILLKGVYVDSKYIYFKFELENASNVPFDVDYIAFSITAERSKKTATQERIQILPVQADADIHRIDAKSVREVIYGFEKFTIGKDKILLAEVLEQGGDRNIGLTVNESYIIEARKL